MWRSLIRCWIGAWTGVLVSVVSFNPACWVRARSCRPMPWTAVLVAPRVMGRTFGCCQAVRLMLSRAGQWPGVGGALLDVGALEHALLLLGGVALLPGADQLAVVDDLDDAARAADPDDLAGQGVAGEVVVPGERHRPGRVDQPVDHARVAGEVVHRCEPVGLVERHLAAVVGAVGPDRGVLGCWVAAGPGAQRLPTPGDLHRAVLAGDLDHLAGERAADAVVGVGERDHAGAGHLAVDHAPGPGRRGVGHQGRGGLAGGDGGCRVRLEGLVVVVATGGGRFGGVPGLGGAGRGWCWGPRWSTGWLWSRLADRGGAGQGALQHRSGPAAQHRQPPKIWGAAPVGWAAQVGVQVAGLQVVGAGQPHDVGRHRLGGAGTHADGQRAQHLGDGTRPHGWAGWRRAPVAPWRWAAWSSPTASRLCLVSCSLPQRIASIAAPRSRWDRLPIIPPVRRCR